MNQFNLIKYINSLNILDGDKKSLEQLMNSDYIDNLADDFQKQGQPIDQAYKHAIDQIINIDL